MCHHLSRTSSGYVVPRRANFVLSVMLVTISRRHVTRRNPIKYHFFPQIFDNQVLNMLNGYKLTLKRIRNVDQPYEACKVETELNLNLKNQNDAPRRPSIYHICVQCSKPKQQTKSIISKLLLKWF